MKAIQFNLLSRCRVGKLPRKFEVMTSPMACIYVKEETMSGYWIFSKPVLSRLFYTTSSCVILFTYFHMWYIWKRNILKEEVFILAHDFYGFNLCPLGFIACCLRQDCMSWRKENIVKEKWEREIGKINKINSLKIFLGWLASSSKLVSPSVYCLIVMLSNYHSVKNASINEMGALMIHSPLKTCQPSLELMSFRKTLQI